MAKIKPLPPIVVLTEVLSYDPESGELRWKVRRSSNANTGDIAGYINKRGYTYIQIDGKNYAAHRICWALHHGEDPYPYPIDHKEGVEKGNAITNLRLATWGENGTNKRMQSNNTSGHRGVRMVKKNRRWEAYLTMGGKTLWLGTYGCVEEAIAARLRAEADNNIYISDRH